MTGRGKTYKKVLRDENGFWKLHLKDCDCSCPKAQLCPVCNGSGYITKTVEYGGTSAHMSQSTCHGCFGYGWVRV